MALSKTVVLKDQHSASDMRLADFVSGLAAEKFSGDTDSSVAAKLVNATDNSIYHVEPALVVYPRCKADLRLVSRLSQMHRIPITARGGCTGTNGQSLTLFVVVDLSRHMNRIIGFDPVAETVTVEPGVVLDQLNAYLRPLGYFFAPTVSTASRATLGGMLATDASGKGSRRYGRTSDYVASMNIVMDDGSTADIADLPLSTLGDGVGNSRLASICRLIAGEVASHAEEIARVYPDMNRGMTGYNLNEVVSKDGTFRLAKLLAGSEGTLALTAEITFRVTQRPSHRALCVLAYDDCLTALRDVQRLLPADPVAIEFIDDKVVALASKSPLWSGLENILGGLSGARGFLFLEIAENSASVVKERVTMLDAILGEKCAQHVGYAQTTNIDEMKALWAMRERSVGLLASMEGSRRGIAFVEDAAVPPENLVGFVQAFRALLDEHDLTYGMYGHADVGCIHVRPLLDMKTPMDRALVREISDTVAELARAHGGLIWGEHGKGYRGEYLPLYTGEAVYNVLRRIKAAFDPCNLLNPGKLLAPKGSDGRIDKIDAVPFRGARDASIDGTVFAVYERAVACNGNGACFNWDVADAMCPSYKASRDRIQSPKGRATLFREWARAASLGIDTGVLAEELKASLDTCLSCKACTSQCPVQVDIPGMKSAFLETYYETTWRPLRDRLLRHLERVSLSGAQWPRLANLVISNPVSTMITRWLFGLRDLPRFPATSFEKQMKRAGVSFLDVDCRLPTGANPIQCVILIPDSFSGVFEPHIWAATAALLQRMGFRVFTAPISENGKALHVRGYGVAFNATARKATRDLSDFARTGASLIGIEPAVVMLYRQEYESLPSSSSYRVSSIDEFLFDHLDRLPSSDRPTDERTYRLFLHCTEKTAEPRTAERWRVIFSTMGGRVEVVRAGCCGMAGLFGHEAENFGKSRKLFDMSWADHISDDGSIVLATGYSCRTQAQRFHGGHFRHPIEVILPQ